MRKIKSGNDSLCLHLFKGYLGFSHSISVTWCVYMSFHTTFLLCLSTRLAALSSPLSSVHVHHFSDGGIWVGLSHIGYSNEWPPTHTSSTLHIAGGAQFWLAFGVWMTHWSSSFFNHAAKVKMGQKVGRLIWGIYSAQKWATSTHVRQLLAC